jgi:3-oxoacyl-[acyl-carrier-protein] synthase-3
MNPCENQFISIASTGRYLPDRLVSNDMLDQFPPNARLLIEQKTGVRERRFARENECTSDLAIRAAAACLDKIGYDPADIGTIILATSSPDRMQPATATRVQSEIKAVNAFAFDINSVCSGSVAGIALAHALISSGLYDSVLLVAAEVYSKITNPADFATFPYFGDGAAAILFLRSKHDRLRIVSELHSAGEGSDVIQVPSGGTRCPAGGGSVPADRYFRMQGKEVYQFAVEKGTDIILSLLNKQGVDKKDISYVIPHQANINIIRDIAANTGIDLSKFLINLDRYGNTAAASVIIAFDELFSSQTIRRGDTVLTVAFGGGLSWGANLLFF